MLARFLFSVLLATSFSVAHAQQAVPAPAKAPAEQTLTPQQKALQAELNKVGPELIKVATQVAERVDQNKAGEVWDGASDIAKAIVTREVFITQVNAARTSAGTVKSRKLDTISSSVYDGRGTSKGGPIIPAGTYINIVFTTQFSANPKAVHELVSFHLDTDKRWRVTGYTLH